jgi:cation transport regulator
MPYKANHELPDPICKHLPSHAQDIYREAFNHAHEEYKDPAKRRDKTTSLEEISHKVAWAAVKKKYEKGEDDNWHPIK